MVAGQVFMYLDTIKWSVNLWLADDFEPDYPAHRTSHRTDTVASFQVKHMCLPSLLTLV